jgi:hypothetical protein
MSQRIKNRIKEILFFLIVLAGLFGWATVGYEMGTKKQIVVEKPVLVPVELDDPKLIEIAIKEASEKYGIREEVFKAIIKCEGGTVFGWNKTQDGGLYQINLETSKQYGAKSLKDIIDPRLSTELAAKILLKEGLKPWRTKDCIEKELIKITK